ncbi:LysE/ArgO family amino acid transporter [Rhodanobacter sp. MP1X3]|uniref:LysE/ArgO family amino acid transporter n=1 Tax=Rhodanobacter sp. MP1X3 TaxID=2723086 RepID=UPI00161D322C|nr:LysE/ArgO family amino acid transporter [Rhodanobacter sp. MP1X3]MBB6241513.1 L-lysine exporter family protein LysE/ArgO [Rhodanobacter sp. MP1X3]
MSSAAYLAGLGTGASLIIAIGAQNAFVLRQGLQRRHVGLVVAICTLSDVTLILLGVAGMGLAVQQHAGLLQWLRYIGAIFLLGYGLLAAWRAWRGTSGLQPTSGDIDADRWRVALACLGFTLLNPHVYLDTVVLLGSVSTHYAGDAHWWFASGAATASVVWFTGLGYGARLLLPWFRSALAWRLLDAFVAVLMLVLASVLLGAFG